MNKDRLIGIISLLVTALIWGFAFSVQSIGSNNLNVFAFNGIRYFLAVATLLIILIIYEVIVKKKNIKTKPWNKATIIGGIICGICIFFGNNLQQYALTVTSVGKTSFITSLYIVIVAVLSLFLKKKPSFLCIIGIVIAVAGFYLMCVSETMSFDVNDIIAFVCSMMFAFQIVFIDLYANETDALRYTFIQFLTAAIISVPAMAIEGFPTTSAINAALAPVLYVGILSAGIAFLLQTVGQHKLDSSTASLIMSLESVIGLIGGMIILNEAHTNRELGGAILIFIAVFLASYEMPKKDKLLKYKDLVSTWNK